MSHGMKLKEVPPRFGINQWKKNHRDPLNPDKQYLPFREIFPMQIRNWVRGAGTNVKQAACVPEMLNLFECLQRNEFHHTNCDQQLAVMQGCYYTHRANVLAMKNAVDQNEPVPGAKKLSTDQLNTLLARFPHKLRKN